MREFKIIILLKIKKRVFCLFFVFKRYCKIAIKLLIRVPKFYVDNLYELMNKNTILVHKSTRIKG